MKIIELPASASPVLISALRADGFAIIFAI